jgi:uncharacterized protein YeaO (DUF488 family)
MAERSVHVAIKRAYETPAPNNGTRVLVDRLWPRGLSKARARVDLWLKDVAPSTQLRRWYGHDPAKFAAFRARYLHELDVEPGARGPGPAARAGAQGTGHTCLRRPRCRAQ